MSGRQVFARTAIKSQKDFHVKIKGNVPGKITLWMLPRKILLGYKVKETLQSVPEMCVSVCGVGPLPTGHHPTLSNRAETKKE